MISTAMSALRTMHRRGPLALATLAIATVAMTGLALSLWVADNVASWTASWRHSAQMVVYLEPEVSTARTEEIAAVLRELDAVRGVSVVSPEMAFDRLVAELGDDPLLAGMDAGALGPSIEVSLRDGVRSVALAHPVAERLRGAAGVADIDVADDWVDELLVMARGFESAASIAVVLALLACTLLITLALGLRSRGEDADAAVYALFSAQGRYVQGPLIVEGVIHGLLGAALALLALTALHVIFGPAIRSLAGAVFGATELHVLSGARMIGVLGVGMASGLVGGAIAGARSARVA